MFDAEWKRLLSPAQLERIATMSVHDANASPPETHAHH